MLTREVDIGLIKATLSPITQVAIVNFRVSHLIIFQLIKISIVMRDLYIGIRPATLPTTTQVGVVDFRFSLLLHILLKYFHDEERGDISGDDEILGFRSQYISHYYFQNL